MTEALRPDRIDRYKVLSLIGQGAMGEVYLAQDTTLQRQVAIKLLRAELTADAGAVARFEQEARAASSLNHPNIVTVHEIGRAGARHFIAMEHVDGRSLAALIGEPAAPATVREIARQLAEALKVAHAAGIVHRDLKPENVRLRPDGYVKLLDFGVARLLSGSDAEEGATRFRTADGQVIGTPRYMSPEQIRGEAATAASDVFALGAVLHELTTGRHPSERDPGRAPRDPLDRLVQRMLDPQAAGRPSAAEIERDVRAQQADSSGPRTWRARLVLGAVTAVLAIAVLAGVAEYRRTRLEEMRARAADVFFNLRALDRDLVRFRQQDPQSAAARDAAARRDTIAQAYDNLVEVLGVYDDVAPANRAILRLARRLGEADLEAPPDFVESTMTFVRRWSGSPQLSRALAHARDAGLIVSIRQSLEAKGLPKEFLLVPLQESVFDAAAVGPPTRAGIAKGLWQITPEVARRYGLALGPLRDQAVFDAADERHDVARSTEAATSHLVDLYVSKAAGSALLALAAYNAGDGVVLRRLEAMPDDPRVRNFWNFYNNQWLPSETRDYVMLIFSAALIAEQPEVFGVPIERLW
jgi:tRNA A-37 threonylcarbamoyl transferase component Bud32